MSYSTNRVNVFNLRDFGGRGDNGTTDNLIAFQKLLKAAGPLPVTPYPNPPFTQWNARAMIYVPPDDGAYEFSGACSIWRAVHLFSNGMGEWAGGYENLGVPPATVRFPKGSAGFVIEQQGVPSPYNPIGAPNNTNTTGRKSIIEGFMIDGSFAGADVGAPGGVPVWEPSTRYNAGDVVIPSYFLPFGYAYQVVVAGVSDVLEPSWSTAEFPFPIPTYQVEDGGVLWALVRADAIMCNTDCTIRDMRIIGAAGNAVAVFADVNRGNGANEMRVYDSFLGYCGGSGIAIAGGDTNAGTYSGITTQHNGGWGLWDFAPLRNTIIGHKDAGSRAGSYWFRSSVAINPYSEAGGGPPVVEDEALLKGGVIGDGFFSGDWFPDWSAGLSVNIDDILLETSSSQYWICLQTGVTGGARPNFTTNAGAPFGRFLGSNPTRNVVIDGTTSWGAYGGAGDSAAPTWRANHDYVTRSKVRATGTQGFAWINNGAPFTSGGVEPVWDVAPGSTTADNGGVWTRITDKGLPLSTGDVNVDTGGAIGTRHTSFVNRAGPIRSTIELSSHTIPNNLLSLFTSDDNAGANLLELLYDPSPATRCYYWSYTGLPQFRFMEWTVAGNTTLGEGQISFPLGIYAGSFFNPAGIVEQSYLGNKFVLAGGTDSHEGHRRGKAVDELDGKVTGDDVEVVAATIALEAGRGQLILVDVSAKTYTTSLDGAVFQLRGAWRLDNVIGVGLTITQISAPAVVFADSSVGAAAWTARLVVNAGTNSIDVMVKGSINQNVIWAVFPHEKDTPVFP